MHREALAGLGESLRRELGDLLDGSPAALADLDEDARRWLGTLDGEMQALAAWLTSSSVWADLPVDAPPAPDAPPRGVKEREALPSPDRIPDADGARRAMERAAGRSSAGLGMSPSGLRQGAPGLRESVPGPREESSRPSEGLHQSPAVTAAPWTSPPRSPSPIAHPSTGRGGSPPAQSLMDVRSRDLPLSRPAEGRWERGIEGVRSGGGRLQSPHDFDGALRPAPPPEPAVPLPSRTDTFTPAKNLHDLARLLSSGEGDDEVSSPRTGAIPPTVETPRGASPSPGVPGAPGVPTAYPDVPAASRRFLEMNAAAGDAPRGVSTVGTMSSGPEGTLGAKAAPAGPGAEGPVSAMVQAPEVDVEPILDALARSVADEYKRFYGS